MNELAVRVGPLQEGNVQKMNFTSETAGLVSQNRTIEELDFDVSGDSNEEEHQKTDYAVVDNSDAPVDESLHKRAQISGLDNYNGGLDGSEHSNEEGDQTIEFAVDNYCESSFD